MSNDSVPADARHHLHVPHPRDLIHHQEGLKAGALAPKGAHWLAKANIRFAFAVAAVYGAAWTIWLLIGYTLLGAIKPSLLVTLLYWSNGVQLVFCSVMTFVGNMLAKQQQAKADADHEALTSIHQGVDEIRQMMEQLIGQVPSATVPVPTSVQQKGGSA